MCAATTSGDSKPVLYLLYGDDRHAMQQLVRDMVSKLGDPTTADMNTTRLSGNQVRIDDVRSAAFAMPFLAERRLVVLNNPQDLMKSQKGQEDFEQLLESLPETTALVLVVEVEREKKDWKSFKEGHWLRKWVRKQPKGRTWLRECALPASAPEMTHWIQEEVRTREGKFMPAAAAELANYVGNNTQLASLEIDKLLTYVDNKRSVEVEDVKDLVADTAPISIFDLVDAMAEGKSAEALRLIHAYLDEGDPFGLFGMIVRQFRLLIMAREVVDAGGRKEQIASELNVHAYVAGKLESQVFRFSMDTLVQIYNRLLTIDEYMKTSQMDLKTALDLFISELALN